MKILKLFALLLFTAMTMSYAEVEAKTVSTHTTTAITTLSPEQHVVVRTGPGYRHREYRRRMYRRRAFFRHRMMERRRFHRRGF